MSISSSTLRVISKFSREEQIHCRRRVARPGKGVKFADSNATSSMTRGRATRMACIVSPWVPVSPVVRMFANGGAASTDLFRLCRGLALVG